MTKFIAIAAAGILAAGSAFAGAKGDCCPATKRVANKENMMACHVSFANLNLTAEQKKKMEAAMKEHEKEGCNEKSEAKYMQQAKSILNKEQYAKFESECKKESKGKTS